MLALAHRLAIRRVLALALRLGLALRRRLRLAQAYRALDDSDSGQARVSLKDSLRARHSAGAREGSRAQI